MTLAAMVALAGYIGGVATPELRRAADDLRQEREALRQDRQARGDSELGRLREQDEALKRIQTRAATVLALHEIELKRIKGAHGGQD